MTKQNRYRRSHIHWGRIALAAVLLALLIWGMTAGVRYSIRQRGEKEEESSSSQAEPVQQMVPAVDLSQWNLILVNAENPLPAGFSITTGQLRNSLEVDARILEAVNTMLADARAQGVELIVCSAYRDLEYQTNLFEKKVKEFLASGCSDAEARAAAGEIVALPGTSEHNTGLALDIVTPEYQMLNDGYADTEAAKWLAAHAPEYGFILRYPKEAEAVTGIIFEPWHYRYVGQEYAREITDSGLCFEEWIQLQKETLVPLTPESGAEQPDSQP